MVTTLSMPAAPPLPAETLGRTSKTLFDILHINGAVMIRPRDTEPAPINVEPLTRREIQVLSLVAEGQSNKMIGAQLSISERTVKNHLTFIMGKLSASDRTHAVVIALRLGLIGI